MLHQNWRARSVHRQGRLNACKLSYACKDDAFALQSRGTTQPTKPAKNKRRFFYRSLQLTVIPGLQQALSAGDL